jgi:hypothetical protein
MLAWHYTISDRAQGIISTGQLNLATVGVRPPERPVVWFTRHQHWEPTANKLAVLRDGTMRTLTTQEMFNEIGGELYRFGIDPARLLPWAVLKRRARISSRVQRDLLRQAKAIGSDHTLWLGSLEPIPLSDLTVQKWNPIAKRWG